MRCSWADVLEMQAIAFFNVLCYTRDKTERDNRAIEEWRKKH